MAQIDDMYMQMIGAQIERDGRYGYLYALNISFILGSMCISYHAHFDQHMTQVPIFVEDLKSGRVKLVLLTDMNQGDRNEARMAAYCAMCGEAYREENVIRMSMVQWMLHTDRDYARKTDADNVLYFEDFRE